MEYILLIVGFALLIKGADFFVDGSSSVAKLMKIPPIVIGLTVVAFGTSLPELAVSVTAAIQGNNELAVSNVLGSNMFNLLMVLGCSALFTPVKAKESLLKREFPFSIFISVILLFLVSDFSIQKVIDGSRSFVLGRWGSALLLVLFVIFICATVRMALKNRGQDIEEDYKVMSPLRSILYIVGGIAGIAYGGDLVVDSASTIAANFGMSQTFIGLTIIAVGTSLPELVTSMVAARKNESDLAIGNVVGSNIFNILLILGISGVISPIVLDVTAVYDTVILIIVNIVGYYAAREKSEIKRTEGIIFILIYIAFFVYVLLR